MDTVIHVVTISTEADNLPVHVVLPRKGSQFITEDSYVLAPIGAISPDSYTAILDEALQVLEVAVTFVVTGKKTSPLRGAGDWYLSQSAPSEG